MFGQKSNPYSGKSSVGVAFLCMLKDSEYEYKRVGSAWRGWQLAVQSCEAQPQQGQPSSSEFATADSKIEKHKITKKAKIQKSKLVKHVQNYKNLKKIGKKQRNGKTLLPGVWNYRLKNIEIQPSFPEFANAFQEKLAVQE